MPPNKTQPPRDAFDAVGRGLQHHGLRRANERAVLTVIGFNGGVSNADIARLSGLAPQTVSAILTDLDAAGLITRGEVRRGRRGQPATPIFLRAEGAFAIGVEIGWRHFEVLIIDLHAQVRLRQRRDYAFPDATTVFDEIVAMIDAMLGELSAEDRERLADIGVAMPTNMAESLLAVGAPEEQRLRWARTDVVSELARRTGLDVTLFNDGNAACWAELIAFAKPRPSNFIYFLISRYIAAGIVGQGTLWEGPSGNSANLGSMLVNDSEGAIQAAHAVASVAALEARLVAAGFAVSAEGMAQWDWASFGPVLDRWIDDSARTLARIAFNTTRVIECELIVVDTILPASILTRLVSRLEAELLRLPVAHATLPQVLPGHNGELAPALGASELTLYRRFLSRSLMDFTN